MDLAKHQRDLLALIKSGSAEAGCTDPYIRKIAGSEELRVVQNIVLSWRQFDIERYCRLTSTLLKKRGLFEETIRAFAATADLSPFIERLGAAFLQQMGRHPDPLISSVARFELFVIRVKLGDPSEYTVEWNTDPVEALNSLAGDRCPNATSGAGLYRTIISGRYPGLVHVMSA